MKAFFKIVFLSLLLGLFSPISLIADKWEEIVKKASLDYVEKRKNEKIAEYNKKAFLAVYRKIYPDLSKDEKKAFSQLGKLTLNASKLNELAENLASADPKKVQSASEEIAINIGTKLSEQINDPYIKGKMTSLLGSTDQIKEISTVLGKVSGGDKKALAKYAANMIINATGGAGVVGFYTKAYETMEYVKDSYMDNTVEDLYQEYKKGKLNKEDFELRSTLGGYATVIRDRMIKQRNEKLERLGDVEVSDKLLDHLTNVSDGDIENEMFAGFAARKDKEEKEKKAQESAKKRENDTKSVLKVLSRISREKHGENWLNRAKYDFVAFMEKVYISTKEDKAFNSNSVVDLKILSNLLSTKLVHGQNSEEYKEAFRKFNEIRNRRLGIEENLDVWTGTFIGSGISIEEDEDEKGNITIYKHNATFRVILSQNGNSLRGTLKTLTLNGKGTKGLDAELYSFTANIRQNIATTEGGSLKLRDNGMTLILVVAGYGETATLKRK